MFFAETTLAFLLRGNGRNRRARQAKSEGCMTVRQRAEIALTNSIKGIYKTGAVW